MSRRLRHFAITSLIGMLLVLAFLGVFYRHVVVGNLEELGELQNVAFAQFLSNSVSPLVWPLLSAPPEHTASDLRRRPEVEKLYRTLRARAHGLPVVKVKVYTLGGLTVFSTDLRQIGEDQSDNPGVLDAAAGRVASSIEHSDAFNAFDSVIEDRDLIQSYVPMRAELDAPPEGVFEVYSDVTPLLRRIGAAQREALAGVVLIMGLFYFILLALYRETNRRLELEEGRRDEYLHEIQQANERLEERVAERTRDLEASHAFLKSVMDGVSDPVMVIDLDFRVTSMNRAARGYIPEALQGSDTIHCYRLSHRLDAPCDGQSHPCPMREVLRSGQPLQVTHQHYLANGDPCYVDVTAAPLHGADGGIIGIVEVNHDITAHRHALVAQRESEQRFRDVAEAAGEYIWETDAQGRYTFLSDRVREVLGYQPEELLGREVRELMAAGEAERVARRLAGDEARTAFRDLEYRSQTRAGETIWQTVSGVPVHGEDQAVIGFRGVGQDITRRKRAELALRESERRSRTIMDRVADGILTTNMEGVVEMCNRTVEHLFGYTSGQIIGRPLSRLLPGIDAAGGAPLVSAVDRELEGRRQDGETFPVELWVGDMQLQDQHKAVAVVRDVTARKRAERALEQARRQTFHQEKMAAIGRLAAGIIHEVGNPIAAISGAVEALRGELSAPREEAGVATLDHLDLIAEHTERLVGITREVADFASPRPGERALLDLNSLVRSASSLLRYDRRLRHIELSLDLDSQLPAIEAVGDHITQVIMNLLINAADACEGLEGRDPVVRVSTRREGERVRLSVEDNCHGMDAETAAHAFEAFYTTKAPGTGTGLGLSLAYSIVSAHDGRIDLESMPGVGTRVVIELPIGQVDV